MENSSPSQLLPEMEQALLRVFETISEQQKTICDQLAKLLAALSKQPDSSLIDELSKLLEPLFEDVAEIKKNQLGESRKEG